MPTDSFPPRRPSLVLERPFETGCSIPSPGSQRRRASTRRRGCWRRCAWETSRKFPGRTRIQPLGARRQSRRMAPHPISPFDLL